MLLSAYRLDDAGRPIIRLLTEDWRIFAEDRLDEFGARSLLAEILDDGDIVRKNFIPAPHAVSDSEEKWENFKQELMYENRFFPKTDIGTERIKELLPYLICEEDEVRRTWYRGRIQTSSAPFPREEMGAPPKERALHGRANPAGIPYLYLASDDVTCVAETRPHPGEVLTVASFTLVTGLKIVDLRDPRGHVSPFELADEDDVLSLRRDIGLLERLGNELTKPVIPRAAATEYIPSQFLCEFVKDCRFHGVMYRSSIADGDNLAIFDNGNASIEEVFQRTVDSISVQIAGT